MLDRLLQVEVARPLIWRVVIKFQSLVPLAFAWPGMFVDVILELLDARVKMWCEGWECVNNDVISFPES
jgi:hypothetical protein